MVNSLLHKFWQSEQYHSFCIIAALWFIKTLFFGIRIQINFFATNTDQVIETNCFLLVSYVMMTKKKLILGFQITHNAPDI